MWIGSYVIILVLILIPRNQVTQKTVARQYCKYFNILSEKREKGYFSSSNVPQS